MRKDALTICLITLVAAIFGAFFRWLQLLNAFEPISALAEPYAATSIILVVYSLLAAALFAAIVWLWLRRYKKSCEAEEAFAAGIKLPMIILCACGAVLILLSAIWLMLASYQRFATMHRLFAVGGIFMGLSLFLLGRNKLPAAELNVLSLIPVLFSCLWLAVCYKDNAEDPVIWHFVMEILAISASAIAYYQLSAYRYGRPKCELCLFFVMLSAYLNIANLFDERGLVMQAFFAVNAIVMLCMEYILISNMHEGKALREEAEL